MKQWFVVHTKSRQESVAEKNLDQQGYETYCPRVQQKKRIRGRWRNMIEPLFPRYLFVRLEQGYDDFSPIRSTLGVSGLVRFGGIPRALSASLVDEIKSFEDEQQKVRIEVQPWQTGDEVEVVEGALTGLKGLFLARNGTERVILLLNLLGREQQVTVAQDAIVLA